MRATVRERGVRTPPLDRPASRAFGAGRRPVVAPRVSLALAALLLFLVSARAEDTEGTPGRWRLSRAAEAQADLSSEDAEALARMESLGYLSGYEPAPDASGVVRHDRERAWPGLNLYVSGDAPRAVLMDMDGSVVHEWRHEFEAVWPDFPTEQLADDTSLYWMHARLLEDGDLLAIYGGLGLIRIDRESNLVWKYQAACHHDLDIRDDGTTLVLIREEHTVPELTSRPIIEDMIAVLDPDGRELDRISLVECFENSRYAQAVRQAVIENQEADLYHTNTLEILDGRLARHHPAFRAGNVLISLRNLSLLAVVDLDRRSVVWAMSGSWREQHDPSVVSDRSILLFDNKGHDGRSRLLEIDPATGQEVWSYVGGGEHPFYSERSGACQRLPNGNTLATESHYGRAFEVTREGEIVWEFLSPARAGERGELVATLFELVRLNPAGSADWLESRSGGSP